MPTTRPATTHLRDDARVRSVVASLPPTSDPDWLLTASHVGEAVALALADPTNLRTAAEGIAAEAMAQSCSTIAGASQLGDQLAAAAASFAGLSLFAYAVPARRVLVVDAVLATGAAIARAVEELQAAGAGEVCGAVLIDLGATGHRAGATAVTEV